MVTIVFSHPWHGSFNNAILETIKTKLEKVKADYNVIDLNKDEFNPVLTEKDLAVYSKGLSTDPLIAKYQEIIRKTDEIVFVFPIWWGTVPAILKGFFDKVLLVNFSHNYENGWTPLLKINKGLLVTTSQSPTENYTNTIEGWFIQQTLNPVGISNVSCINNDETSYGSQEKREAFLEKVATMV